jgi:plastocyanin
MRSAWVRAIVITVVAAGLLLPAGSSHARRVRVSVSGNLWSPAHPAVGKGDVVIWRNDSSRFHNVVAYGGNWRKSAPLGPGQRTKRRFRKVGTFKFLCTLHATLKRGRCRGMCGIVHVLSS